MESSEQRALAIEAVTIADLEVEEALGDLHHSVDLARQMGCTWQEIGDALGVTRQAAQMRFGR